MLAGVFTEVGGERAMTAAEAAESARASNAVERPTLCLRHHA